jgi:hypothetical protein
MKNNLTEHVQEEIDKKIDLFVIGHQMDRVFGNYCAQELKDFLRTLLSESKLKTIELLKEEIKLLKTDERKVAVFGKGMDSWEAGTYDEKQLVNAVLSQVITLLDTIIQKIKLQMK